jgi:hypothetical protein
MHVFKISKIEDKGKARVVPVSAVLFDGRIEGATET